MTGDGIGRRSVLSLCATAAFAGCTRADHADVTMWGMSYAGVNAPVLLPRFTRETGLSVALQSLPWTAAHEKILTGFAGNALPDLLMVSNAWLPELVAIGAVRPLPGGIAALGGQLPAAVSGVTVGGTPRALPWQIGTQAQFYRPDLLAAAGYAAPPPRRDAWIGMLRAIKRRAPDRFALLMLLDWPEHLMTFAAQEGAAPLRDDARFGNFASPAFRAALALYKALFDEGLAPRATIADIGDPITAFARGLFAVMPAEAYTRGDLLAHTAEITPAQWRVAALPGLVGPGPAPVGGSSLVVTAQSRAPDRAWALARYLGRADSQIRLYEITGELPTRRAAWRAPALAGDPVARVFGEQLGRPVFAPTIPEWPRIRDEVQLVAERVARGTMGVGEAVVEMDRRAGRLLAKRRWLLDKGLVA